MREEISHHSIAMELIQKEKKRKDTPVRQYFLMIEITYDSRTSSAELKIHR